MTSAAQAESKFVAALLEFAKAHTNDKSYDDRTRATKEIVFAGEKSPDTAITTSLDSAKNIAATIVILTATTDMQKIRAQKPFAIVAEDASLPYKVYQNWYAEIIESSTFVQSKLLTGSFVSEVRGNATFRTVLRDKNLHKSLVAQLENYNKNYNKSNKNIARVIDPQKSDVENYMAIGQAYLAKRAQESSADALQYAKYRASDFYDFFSANATTTPKNILDFASGTGANSYHFAKKWTSARVYACDIRDVVFNAEAKKSGVVDFRATGSETPDLAKTFADVTGGFDLIICSLAMHHFSDLDAVAQQLFAATSRGGYLMIMEHDCATREYAAFLDIVHGMWANILNKESPTIEEWQQTYFATYATRNAWTKLLEKIGYEFIIAKNFGKYDPQQRYFALYKRA
jgi:SAM-dependent methyltransferase